MPATSNPAPQSTPTNGRSKPPSLLACIPCRKSHLKCDGGKPRCTRCQDRNGDCFWVESKRGYREFRKSHQSQTSDKAKPDPKQHKESGTPTSSASGPQGDLDPLQTRTVAYEEIFQANRASFSSLALDGPLRQAFGQPVGSSPSSRSDSTLSITRDVVHTAPHNNYESADLIELYYRHFHPAHPFLVPWKSFQTNPSLMPSHLEANLRFIASHYLHGSDPLIWEPTARVVLDDNVPEDGFKVQGILLYSFACFSRMEQDKGSAAVTKVIDMALRLGMNRESFAIQHGQNDPTLQESWRRTWWTLFALEALTAAIGGHPLPFRLHNHFTDVALPGDDAEYENLRSSPLPRSLDEFRNRTFAEDNFQYSSFAYVVEGAHILGSVLALSPDTFTVTDPQVEALDASISNFLLSLPLDKRDSVRPDGTVDECLLCGHLLINWAAIALHRPRSTLTFIRNHYRTTCTRAEAAGLPALAYSSHTAKAIRAANAMINLASIHRSMAYCTPALMCGITTAATVHLPAYAIVDRPDQAIAIKERLQLGVSALAVFGEIWPRAIIAKGQIAKFAREILLKPNLSVDSTGCDPIPKISAEPLSQIEYDMPFNNDLWMENLLQAEIDEEVCIHFGASSYPPLTNPQGV